MSNNSPTTTVLILHDHSDLYLDQFKARFPQLKFVVCAVAEQVQATLDKHQPQVVLSNKTSALRGDAHRIAAHYPSVKWLQVCGAGFEHILPMERDDVVITNATGVLSDFMAECVLGTLLMLNFGAHRFLDQQRRHEWKKHLWTGLKGKTALIIGLGEIGRRVASHYRYMGMQVLGLRRQAGTVDEVDEIITPENLPSALARADVLSVHVPLIDSTRNLINREAFGHMKPGIIIVNTARGGVMDESALLDALASDHVAAAHLDVFATEPLPADDPLWDAPNLLITPHVADSVTDWETRFAMFFADNLDLWLEGKPLMKVVSTTRGY